MAVSFRAVTERKKRNARVRSSRSGGRRRGPPARSAVLVGEVSFARRFFSRRRSPAATRLALPPHIKNAPFCSSFQREPFFSPRSLVAATLRSRRPLECVFGKHHPNFVVVRAVFRLAASSKTIDDAALRSSGVRVSNPVRPAANTSGDTKKCLLFFYKRSSSPRPAAQPGSDRK